MSRVEVDKIQQQCGSTLTVGGGASKTVTVDATTVTLGRCSGTVSLASGATQSGFGRTGTVDWQTGSIKTATFTATNGEGYFCNTSGGAFTVNLPAGTAGNIVSVVDYTNTFQTHNLTITPNGSEKIGGENANAVLSTSGQSVTFVYVDGTEGWKNVQDSTSNVIGNPYLKATGGTITTCGTDKIHTFTGPGTFCVSEVAAAPACNQVSYIVVAAGGAGGTSDNGHQGGGGGAGGFREDKSPTTPYTSSPLEGAGTITVSATGYPITVGSGGAAATSAITKGGDGNPSVFSTITSTAGGGGGAGANPGSCRSGGNGGSGGGSGGSDQPPVSGGTGNTPPVSPAQGFAGGPGQQGSGAGGSGGGATAAGAQSPSASVTHPGGAGATTSISFSPVVYSDGGPTLGSPGSGADGAANSGDGGQAAMQTNCAGNGGSGVVIIRYKYS